MKYSEFQRWLLAQGATVDKKRGKGSHRIVTLNGKTTTFPYHGAKEMGEGLRKKILKDLEAE